MPGIKVKGLAGEAPRVHRTLLQAYQSQQAINCDLASGEVRPWKLPVLVEELVQTGFLKTIHKYTTDVAVDVWLQWQEDVDVLFGAIAGDSTNLTVFTGTDKPRIFDNTMVDTGGDNNFPESSFTLGLPKPTNNLVATLGAGGSGSARDLNYVYTFVRKWSGGKEDEGEPSSPSNTVNALPGQVVTITNFDTAPAATYGITHLRIYRIVAGTAGAEYQYVTEKAIGTTSVDDSALDEDLAEVLPTTYWKAPPDGLKGVVKLANGCIAGFLGNEVYISEPYQLHAFPDAHRYTVGDPIVALGVIDNMIVVATTNQPTLLYGLDPGAMTPKTINKQLPCWSKRGLVSTEQGVFFPSSEGLAWIGHGGQADIATRKILDEKQWRKLNPTTIHAEVLNGRYYAWRKTQLINGVQFGEGLIFQLSSMIEDMTRAGFYAHASYVDPDDGKLYICEDKNGVNKVSEWNAGGDELTYTWVSKEFTASEAINLGAVQIVGDFDRGASEEEIAANEAYRQQILAENAALLAILGSPGGAIGDDDINGHALNGDMLKPVPPVYQPPTGTCFRLFADGKEVWGGTIDSGLPQRLPDGYLTRRFYFELCGKMPVSEVRAATSIEDLIDA